MKGYVVLLSLSVTVSLVNVVVGQFGFFQRRDDYQSPFNVATNFLPNPRRLRDRISGLFNLRPERPRPAIITDQDREQSDQPYYPNQNNFNRPVSFPTASPYERPVDMYYPREDQESLYNPNWQNRPVEYPNTQQYPNNEPNDVNTNQEYTERPVSFPTADPNSPSSGYDYNVNTGFGDQQQTQEGNGQTTQYDQDKSQSSTTFNQETPSATEPVANNDYTTKAAGFEELSGTEKYQDRFGTGSLPNLAETPHYESRDSNFGPSGFFTETCQTVENEIGSCINLKRCEPYLKILQQYRTNAGAVQLLRKAHCGFDGNDPKVCCPLPGFSTAAPIITTTTTPAPPSTTTTTKAPAPVTEGSGQTIGLEDFVPSFPEPPVCGVSNASFSRVVGGVDAKLGDFPWMALLGYRKRNNPTQWLCGGSLVTSKHVLTAAHCIHTKENELYLVRLGELDIIRDDEGATPVDIFIKHLIKHENYSPKAYTNDIAIIVLEREVEFTDLIRPICIPQAAELRATSFEDYTPMVAGWGNLEARGPAATVLQVVQLPVVSNDFCKQAYRNYTQQKIDERVLCAGYKKGGKDSCRGDSGGPLMQPIWNNKSFKTYFFQIGVVSFGKGCAEAGFPGVYSRVTHFIPWLEQKILGQA